jgi:transposase InsO family protein
MSLDEKVKKQQEIRDFRYQLVGELSNPHLTHGQLKRMIQEKSQKQYKIPHSTKTRVTSATIKLWLKKYRKYGYEGLMPKLRRDYRTSKALTTDEQDALLALLEKEPELTAKAAMKKLQEGGRISQNVSKSSLYRFLKTAGFDRKPRNQQDEIRKFNFEYPLECVQADCMHGFPVDDGKGKKRKAILTAFIDDATRRIVYARFSFSEASIAFEQGIKHILLTHGLILKLYTDNGSTFVSSQTQRILNILGIPLVHSKPGVPRGRGKIERFFRTVRDQFLRPLDKESVTGLGDLNTRFTTWLETEYHRNPHRGLGGQTPLDAWLSKTKYLLEMDRSINLTKIFQHETKRKVYGDATFTLHGNLFEAPPILIGKKISLCYDPETPFWNTRIMHEGKEYGVAKPVQTYANTKVKRGHYSKQTEVVEPEEQQQKKQETGPPVWLNASKAGARK